MWRTTLRTLIVLGAVGGLLAAHAISAQAVEINDEAGFFSKAALEKANGQIAELQTKHGKEVRIETFKTVPGGKADDVAKMTKADREKFFKNWARDRALAERAKGIFVLICKQPGHVQIAEDRQTRTQGFGIAEGDELRDKFLAGFKHKDYDQALLDGVDYISRTVKMKVPERSAADAAAPTPNHTGAPHNRGANHGLGQHNPAGGEGMGWLGWVLVAVVVFFGLRLIGAIFRGIMGGGQPAGAGYGGGPGYGGGYGGGGGGMLGGLMTGMLGAFAGNYLYNSFFGNSAHAGQSTFGGDNDTGHISNDGAGEDFQGSGGDFDSNDDVASGGGDFDGGGDNGGGGDWGGGGGDFGGGGDSGGGDF